MALFIKLSLYFFALFILCIKSENPSIRLSLNQKGLSDIKNYLLPNIISEIIKVKLPEIHQSSWAYDLDLTNLLINNFDLTPQNIEIDFQNNKIHVSLTNVNIGISGDLQLKMFGTHNGKMTAKIASINIQIDISINLNDKSHYQIAISNVNMSLGNLDLKIEGAFFLKFISWIAGLFSGTIKSQVQKQIVQTLNNQVPQFANQILDNLPDEVTLNLIAFNLGLAYKPTSSPVINNGNIDIDLYIYSYYYNKTKPELPEPVPFQKFTGDKGENFLISDYLINSILISVFESQILKYVLIQLPGTQYITKAEDLEFFFPNFSQKYGAKTKVIYFCEFGQAPSINFLPPNNDITANLSIRCDVQPIMPYPITVGYLDLNVSVSINVNLSDKNSLILNFTRADCTDLSIHNIDYHAEYINILKETIDMGMKFAAKVINLNITIPEFEGISLKNPDLLFGTNQAILQTDLNFESFKFNSEKFIHFYNNYCWVNFMEEIDISKFLSKKKDQK